MIEKSKPFTVCDVRARFYENVSIIYKAPIQQHAVLSKLTEDIQCTIVYAMTGTWTNIVVYNAYLVEKGNVKCQIII